LRLRTSRSGIGSRRNGVNRSAAVIGIVIIVNACLWGMAMIMSSRALSGTGGYAEIQHILGGSAAASLIVVGGGLGSLAAQMRRSGKE
jgi:hypothetical protein